MPKRLSPEQLRKTCSPESIANFGDQSPTDQANIIGQDRAVKALEFGLGIRAKGFNIYVAGSPGTGKSTVLKMYLEDLGQNKERPSDYCYVYNFADPDRPRALCFPPGDGRAFRDCMKTLVRRACQEIPEAFQSDDYALRRDRITSKKAQFREGAMNQFEQRAREQGFVLQATKVGLLLAPAVNGQPIDEQHLVELSMDQRKKLETQRGILENDLKAALKGIRYSEQEAQASLTKLDREVAIYVVGGLFEDLEENYGSLADVVKYLQDAKEDIVTHVAQFVAGSEQRGTGDIAGQAARELSFRKYEVNVLVDNAEAVGIPVVIENHPTYSNLFGKIEKETVYGAVQTDVTLIKAGSLLRSNGGFLVVQADDLIRIPVAYEALKRALRSQQTTVEDMAEQMGAISLNSLRPETIPLNVKIVMLGSVAMYHALYGQDEDFREMFKVRAEFDNQMDWTQEGILHYNNFVTTLCDREGLRSLDSTAVARLVEEGSRLAEDQEKLSTRFGDLADIIREADYWASEERSSNVTVDHVRQAVQSKIYRANGGEKRVQEMMQRGTFLIDTSGSVVGQVNGLVVLNFGDYAFGHPSRITASVGLGQSGLLDIERESHLGGPIRTKGVLILAGYLSQIYGQDKPLAMNARLVFEQSYQSVDGDSASSAELYTLLSNLSGVPIKQGLAVTGSVNQKGQIQAIGGVNQKIEGFFDICGLTGLTGEQGVLIPASNTKNLMLRDDVVKAVRDGVFHVYPVDTVDQGIELLTGIPAGDRIGQDSFPEGTINDLVDRRLWDLVQALSDFEPWKGATSKPANGSAH